MFSGMNEQLAHVFAGAGAGIATSLVVCPLDVVKVRIQGQLPSSSTSGTAVNWRSMSVTGSLQYIFRSEGLRGLYRGLGTTMFTYIPAMAVYFPSYNWAKHYWIGPIRSSTGWTNVDVYSPSVHIAAAVTAGCMTNTFTQPLWLVRTRQMSASVPMGTMSTLKWIVRKEGVRALYKGLGSSMFGLFHVIIQFPLYERLKLVQRTNRTDKNTTWQILLASTISKVCASTTTYPHEIIRTRLQLQTEKAAKYRGIWHAVRTIAAEEGLRGFYGGLRVNVMRVVPASAITFISYEKILQFIDPPI